MTIRRIASVLLWVGLNALVLEVATRAWFAYQVGPRVLFYGTPLHRNVAPGPKPRTDPFAASVQSHKNEVGGRYDPYEAGATTYSKYFPHEKKWTESPDRKKRYPVRINAHGFRGEDFAIEKPADHVRVLALGASSTFGYHNRDEETYPVLLERELERTAAPGQHFEVINFAIPHATSDNILAMFVAEGLRLDPDVVTFYEGANDGATIEPREGEAAETWREALVDRSLLAALLDRVVPHTEAVDVAWWWSDELAERRSRAYLRNLTRLAALCEEHGIRLVVATQQMNSGLVPAPERRGLSYDEELELVRNRVANGEIGPGLDLVPGLAFEQRVTGGEPRAIRTLAQIDPGRVMRIHARLMADLRAWAREAGVGFVDGIRALDEDRHLMVNWVHLRPEANAILARALADAIRGELGGRRRDGR